MENTDSKKTNPELSEATLELSKRLKKLRSSRGWSQAQLAKKLGVNAQRISKYERAIMAPPINMLTKIAEVYEVSADYLLCNKNDASVSIKNKELLNRIEELGKLPEQDQRLFTILLDTFIKKRKLEEIIKTNELKDTMLYED